MSPRTLIVALAAALALGPALWLRKSPPADTPTAEPAGEARGDAGATPDPGTPTATPTPAPPSPLAPGTALHGLRLLSREESAERGWAPPPKIPTAREHAKAIAREKWTATQISLDCTDRPLADVLGELRRYPGLEIRVDPELTLEPHRVTCRFDQAPADTVVEQILDQIGLRGVVDAGGLVWITTEDRAVIFSRDPDFDEPMAIMSHLVRSGARLAAFLEQETERRREWLKARTVSLSIIHLPLKEAIQSLAHAAGFQIRAWSENAEDALARAPAVSLVEENLPLEDALRQLLSMADLEFDLVSTDAVEIMTTEDLSGWRAKEDDVVNIVREYAEGRATVAGRKVRIEGRVLTVRDVAAQLESQLGVKVILMPALERCESTWEADGLEQTAGEILSILEKDAPLIWGWYPQLDGEKLLDDAAIWLVESE